MSRAGRAILAVGAAAAIAVAGCGKVGDGTVTDDWPVFAEAKLRLPVAGTCSTVQVTTAYAYNLTANMLTSVAACADAHHSELVHLGAFTGAEAAAADPPPSGSDVRRRAFEECGAKTREFLGDDWRAGRFSLQLMLPPPWQWPAGARYFRCELVSVESELAGPAQVRGTAKDGLRGSRPAAIGCIDLTNLTEDGDYDDLAPMDCSQPHHAEFAGVFRIPDIPYPTGDQADRIYRVACLGLFAQYLGIGVDALLRLDFGYVAWPSTRESWTLGDRAVSCYIGGSGTKKLRASVRGWGARALPT